MDLNAVRMLVQVAEARSFTAAAGQLGISQSGLSRAIGRLESELGVRLLQRTTRAVSLTPDGRQFVEHCTPLLCGLEDAERRLGDRPCTPSGVLKLTAPSMFGRKVLVPLTGQLMARYPQLQFELVLNDRLVDLVEEGFDAALRTGPISDVRMVARPLRPLRWVTVASPGYIARHGAPESVDALQDHTCLAVRNLRSGRLVDWQFRDGDGLRDFTAPARMVFDSGDPLVEGALAGVGIVQVMDFAVADALAGGRLVRVLEPFEGRTRALSLVYPPSRQASPKLKVLAEALSAGTW
ncbi:MULTISPECIES: LysR family transcriptional regulator [Stenotrophomonas]|jgi:DNA-binding transcriptional LysR family regulator|uniref:DNA-binding transcriptional LysR family regulator n=1 Tax=Stenotrophomonas rhizophila TaxID=216778 RepID=A0AAP5EEP1_9GAMM|nr:MULTISPECIES: LysR family transcriptional regulator [Stenotrophomonas]MDQ1063772.1 DNA-binding transcriptional LysR family regulator [Stenotrophomonas sp. SORGH_AS_0282]MDQ1109756.1 DNA-binding transcriptional LysR family regulator [Stenotrophomonas rhizophila]MDQ1187861.1 DNA-binding transcriptional LysR family regulator [Stenotrophomonas sp. SORGH_AS_0282]UQY88412.1 LysR family transcriptional regulator [Stenotrophomonas rhizophila]